MSALHADALAVLEGWRAPDAGQERLRRRYVDYLRAHADAMTRAGRPHHLTASTLVLDAGRERVLLTLHAKSGRWFQLGGHAEPDDVSLAGAALREAVEESGLSSADLDLDPVPLLLDEHAVPFCGPGEGVHHLDVVFVATARAGAAPRISEESLDLRWWPVSALPGAEDGDGEIAGFVARAQASPSGTVSSGSVAPGGGSSRAAADQPSR